MRVVAVSCVKKNSWLKNSVQGRIVEVELVKMLACVVAISDTCSRDRVVGVGSTGGWLATQLPLHRLYGFKYIKTHPRAGLENNCFVGEGTTVPVDETDEVSSSTSSWGSMPGTGGSSDGNLASFALAKDF